MPRIGSGSSPERAFMFHSGRAQTRSLQSHGSTIARGGTVVITAFRCVRLLAIALALAASAFAVSARASDGSPVGLVITYQTAPANRPVLRQQMRESELRRFERWKQDGVLQDYRILFSRYVD